MRLTAKENYPLSLVLLKPNPSPLPWKRNKTTTSLTHDLLQNFAERFDIVVKQVIIHVS
jgi:hypothetical protein